MSASNGKGYLEFDQFSVYITQTPIYQQIEKDPKNKIVHIWPNDKLKVELQIDNFNTHEEFSKFYFDWSTYTHHFGYHYLSNNGDCSITLYCIRSDGKTIPMHTFVFDNSSKVDRFMYLVSEEYLKVRKAEDSATRLKQIEEFCAKIPDLANELYILTQQYFDELLGSELVSILDMPKLVKSAQQNLFELVYKHGHREVQIPENLDQYDGMDESYEEFCCEIDYDMFYEYYPLFKKFSSLVYDLTKDEGPNGDCVCGSKVAELNRKYHTKMIKLAKNKFLP